jgi:hypothetical protein
MRLFWRLRGQCAKLITLYVLALSRRSSVLLLPILLSSGLSHAHSAGDASQFARILQEIQAQGRELRDIQARLEARDADQFARKLVEGENDEGASASYQTPNTVDKQTHESSSHDGVEGSERTAAQNKWRQTLAQQARRVKSVKAEARPMVSVVQDLESAAPDLITVLDAMAKHASLRPELRQLATLALRQPEVVADWVSWLDVASAPGLLHIADWVQVLQQQGHLLRAVSLVRTPLRAGSLNLSRGRRTALAAMLSLALDDTATVMDKQTATALAESLRADLENLFIYGDDRLYTYSVLKPLYRGAPNQAAAWSDLIQRAWRQSRHSAQAERAFAPLAARMGNRDALQVWVADELASVGVIHNRGGGVSASDEGKVPSDQADYPASALARITELLAERPLGHNGVVSGIANKNASERLVKFQKILSGLIAHPKSADVFSFFYANRQRLVFDEVQGLYVVH